MTSFYSQEVPRLLIKTYIIQRALASFSQWLEPQPSDQRVMGLITNQEHIPELPGQSLAPWRGNQLKPINVSLTTMPLSLSLLPPFPPFFPPSIPPSFFSNLSKNQWEKNCLVRINNSNNKMIYKKKSRRIYCSEPEEHQRQK